MGLAIKDIIARRESSAAPSEGIPPEGAEGAPADEPSAPAPEPEQKGLPPEALVELERRERAMDQLRYELQSRDSELERLRSSTGDWRQLLSQHGHKVEDIVQEWLTDAPAKQGGAQTTKEDKPVPEYLSRLEQLESRLKKEDSERQRQARLAEIRGLTPEDSEEFELTRAMEWHPTFLAHMEQLESQQKRQIGPQELQKNIREFEKASRQQVEKEIDRLAKTKFGRSLMARLLSAKNNPASQSAEAPPEPPSAREPDALTQDRVLRLSRQDSSDRFEQIKRKALNRWR